MKLVIRLISCCPVGCYTRNYGRHCSKDDATHFPSVEVASDTENELTILDIFIVFYINTIMDRDTKNSGTNVTISKKEKSKNKTKSITTIREKSKIDNRNILSGLENVGLSDGIIKNIVEKHNKHIGVGPSVSAHGSGSGNLDGQKEIVLEKEVRKWKTRTYFASMICLTVSLLYYFAGDDISRLIGQPGCMTFVESRFIYGAKARYYLLVIRHYVQVVMSYIYTHVSGLVDMV